MDKREKKDMKSPRKQLHKEYFTKRLFSKSIKRKSVNNDIKNKIKEQPNCTNLNTKTSASSASKRTKKLIISLESINKNSNLNIQFLEENKIEKNSRKKNLKYSFNNSKNKKIYNTIPCSNNIVFCKDTEDSKYENKINSKILKSNNCRQFERKSNIIDNKNLNNKIFHRLLNYKLIRNNKKLLHLDSQNLSDKNKISFYFNDKIEKMEEGESHLIKNSFIDNNFEKDIVINNRTKDDNNENYLLIPCKKCSQMVNIDEIDEHSNNCIKIEQKITIPNNINNNNKTNRNIIFDIKDYSYGEMVTNCETMDFFDLNKMGKILDEKRNFKMQKFDNFINEEKNKRLFLMEVLKAKFKKINKNTNVNLIPDILIWKEAEKKKIDKNNWPKFIMDELNNPNKYLKIIKNEKKCK